MQEKYINPAQKEILVVDVIKRQLIRGLVLYFLVANIFILLRIILRLTGANPENFFAGFIYAVSGFLLLPFIDILPQHSEPFVSGRPVLDISAFIGGFCINVLIFLAIMSVYIGTRMIKTRKQTQETVEKSKTVDATKAEQAVD